MGCFHANIGSESFSQSVVTKVKISNLSIFFTSYFLHFPTSLSSLLPLSVSHGQMPNDLRNMSTQGITLVKEYLAFNPTGYKQVEI